MFQGFFTKSKNYKTGPLFFDGVSWNFIYYDPNSKKIFFDYISSDESYENNYQCLMNMIGKQIIPDVIGDRLFLCIDNGKVIVEISIVKRYNCCFIDKNLRAKYTNYPNNLVVTSEVEVRSVLDMADQRDWDSIVEFINNVRE